jgi:branched-chain amino acid transport system permease protein
VPLWLDTFLQQILNGTTAGALYVLIAIGITLIYGLTGIVNFAHGELLMIGAYVTFSLVSAFHFPFFVALVAAIVGLGMIGAVVQLGMFRWTLARPITGFIVSLGLISVLQAAAIQIWTTDPKSITAPYPGVILIGDLRFPIQRLILLILSAAFLAVTLVFLTRSRSGRALRAAAEDREMAGLLGVNTPQIILLAFCLGCALAGAAGGLVISVAPITPFAGGNYVFKGFAVALVGGLGSVSGAAVIGFTLGIVEALLTSYVDPTWREAYIFVIMIAVLLIRPTGLFRGTEGASML